MLGAALVHGGENLFWTGAGASQYASARAFMGVPFLHPWANRLERFGYRAGGRDVVLDPQSPLLLLDDNGLPIHGVLNASRMWSVRESSATDSVARLVAVLEFDDHDLLGTFPFPHRIEMEVGVGGGALRVAITLTATGDESVPVAFGFHPYLRLPDIPRAEWEVMFPVSRRVLLDDRMLPTGAAEPVDSIAGPIGERTWDDCFDGLNSPARFEVSGGDRRLQVDFDQGYRVAQIFAPSGEEYVCIEPMTAPVNSLVGPDDGLTWVRPGHQYSASFRISCHRRPAEHRS
jgi:galactose mutarotase-like enzyme